MKLTARKSFIAAATAVALSTGALQAAPAWAEDSDSSSSSSGFSFGSSDAGEKHCKPIMEEKEIDGKKQLVDTGKQECKSRKKEMTEEIKEWVGLITTIASLFAAVLSITKTTDNLAKAFAPK